MLNSGGVDQSTGSEEVLLLPLKHEFRDVCKNVLHGLAPRANLGAKWVKLALNGTNPGFFRSDSEHFGAPRQNVLNLI